MCCSVIDVPKWPVVLPHMPLVFLHLVDKHVHAFDHWKITSWHLQVMFRIKQWRYWECFPTINSEFYGRFFQLFVDRPDRFWMSGITCMFWWCTVCNTVYLVVIQRHTLFKPFNYCLMPQDMITGGGLLRYLHRTVSITVDCLFHLQTIRFHDNRKKWNHNMWVGCP